MALKDDLRDWEQLKEQMKERTERWKKDVKSIPDDWVGLKGGIVSISQAYDKDMRRLESAKKKLAKKLQKSLKQAPGNAAIKKAKDKLDDIEKKRLKAIDEAHAKLHKAKHVNDDVVGRYLEEVKKARKDFWKAKYKILDDLAKALL